MTGTELEPRNIAGQDAALVADAYEAEALTIIEQITDPDEADALLRRVTLLEQAIRLAKLGADRERRWGAVKLRAERKYGELLGPAKRGAPAGNDRATKNRLTDCESNSESTWQDRLKARRVAAVPDDAFEDYVTNTPRPSRNGLLSANGIRGFGEGASGTRSRRAPRKVTEELIAACMTGIRQGKGQGEIGKGLGLADNSMVLAQAFGIATDRLAAEGDGDGKRAARARNWDGKTTAGRARELKERGKPDEAARLAFYQAQVTIAKLNAALESIPLDGYDLDEPTLGWLTDFHDDLVAHAAWTDRTLSVVQNRLGDADVRRKIEILRNPDGRTPEEAEAMARLADRLEAKLGHRLEAP
jgi:hypothetical protein